MLGGIVKEVEDFLAANSPDIDVQTYSFDGETEETIERRVEYGLNIKYKHKHIKNDFILIYSLELVYFSPTRENHLGSGDIKFSCIKDPERNKGARLGETARDMIYSGIETLIPKNSNIQYKIRAVSNNRYIEKEEGEEKFEFVTHRNYFFVRMKGALENFISEDEFVNSENMREIEKLENHIVKKAHEEVKQYRQFRQSSGQG